MGVRQAGMYSTADAVIRTEVQADPQTALACVLRTGVTYTWPVHVRGQRSNAPLECELHRDDRLMLREAWNELFDYVVGIQLNSPVSMAWELNIRELQRCDVWLRGAVQTLVEIVSAEIGVPLKIVARSRVGGPAL